MGMASQDIMPRFSKIRGSVRGLPSSPSRWRCGNVLSMVTIFSQGLSLLVRGYLRPVMQHSVDEQCLAHIGHDIRPSYSRMQECTT